jgi:TRAP-type mannitol/chloroaromatic compound transport system substrate-binding protein
MKKQKGVATPLIILALVASLVLVFGLLVMEKSRNFQSNLQQEQQVTNSEDIFEWRMATSWPKNFPGIGMGPENFATLVDRMSNGRLRSEEHTSELQSH